MTVPPGGPYGQDPYGANPYGETQWGGQPQGYPYPQGGPYQQGGYPPQQYPPAGQQYPQPGQQVPPGWPTGGYPPGPPGPGPKRSKLPWLILAGIAVVGVIALVAILVFAGGNGNKSNNAATTSAAPTTPATSQPANTEQTATDCTPNVSPGDKPTGDMISAGKLSFPASAAPGWQPFADDQSPNMIGGVGVGAEVPGASNWMMQAEVGITNFVPSMDVAAQASKFMDCTATGQGYANASPTLGPKKTSSMKVDGVNAARVDADITIADPARNVKGDSVTIIAVDTKPVTVFFGATPIGDAASAGIINGVIAALKVAKS